MGFFGDLVLARWERPLLELDVFRGGCQDGHDGCVTALASRPGGWQMAKVLHGLPEDAEHPALERIVRGTGAPALIASMLDSELGVVEVDGMGPSGREWTAALDPGMFEECGLPVPDVEVAARSILGWAEEAGVVADVDAVRAVLTSEGDPFEDLLFALIDACGFPEPFPEPRGGFGDAATGQPIR